MTGNVETAARWLGLSGVAASLIVVIGLRLPTPTVGGPPNDPINLIQSLHESEHSGPPDHMTPERIHGGIM